MTISLSRRTRTILIVTGVVLTALLILIAAFPIGWFKGRIEEQLSRQFGGATHIGTLDRETPFSFSPIIRVADLNIPQQPWAGSGDLASVRLLRVRVDIFPFLMGRTNIAILTASGIRLDLVRDARGRTNWGEDGNGDSAGGHTQFTAFSIDDTVIRYRDALQNRAFTLSVKSDPIGGLVGQGTGSVDGAPVTLHIKGAAMHFDRAWPFEATIGGEALTMIAKGSMAAPLRTDAMTFHMSARADDLKRVDRVIEAGLFGTQPINLTADVRREPGAWIVKGLTGTIGRSDLRGHIIARKTGGRVKLDGAVHFGRLDFDDLASDAGNAKAVALEKAIGLRLVPNTRIDIRKIDKTDGRIAVRVDHILGDRRPSALTNISGILTLDNRLLTVEPLRIGLTRGAITGKMIVDQRAGQAHPLVTLALDMTDSRISTLAGGESGIDGRMDARVRLKGVGSTLREAVGRSNGTIGIIARNGTLPAKIAALIGFDVGRGLLGGDKDKAPLRCAIVRMDMENGLGSFAPLLIDTSMSQTRGTGAISFPGESIAATLTGAPKQDAVLVVPGYIIARGTIREPKIMVPPKTKSVGNMLKAIGRAISGHDEQLATDADCAALSRRAIGR